MEKVKLRSRWRSPFYISALFFVQLICTICAQDSVDIGTTFDPFKHTEVLAPGRFTLQWFADWDETRITFNITARTRGYVGLGLSRRGKMSGADIVMGGVLANGQPYFSDRHAIGNQVPEEDDRDDYTLHSAWENGTHTFLSFSRPFDTCDDDHDLPINDHFISLLWAYGENDNITEYHFQNRGNFDVYLLDADLTPPVIKDAVGNRYSNLSTRNLDLGDWKVWPIDISQPIGPQDTSYICTFHKVPRHPTKRHIVGFRSVMGGELERRHIHHFLLHKCYPPRGVDANKFFGRFVDKPGVQCYVLTMPSSIPAEYCREVNHAWAVGSPSVYFVSHVGVPMNDEPDEYVMLQMHYDNPQLVPRLRLNFSLEVFYTEKLREFDGGLIYTGIATPGAPSVVLPSHEVSHPTYGHCAAGCTKEMFPESGINVFATILHTHIAGISFRMQHFRGDKELSWVLHDDNYNFNFQPIRTLREERVFLPGDTIIDRCTVQTTDRNGIGTVGGFSTRNEMCNAFIWYYPYIRKNVYGICSSEIRNHAYRDFLGIWNETWSDARREFVVTSPPENAGLRVSDVITRSNWTIARRHQLQEFHDTLPQITGCPILRENERISLATPAPVAPPRPTTPEDPLSISAAEREILRPGQEYVSVYPRNAVPYQPTRTCNRIDHGGVYRNKPSLYY